MTSGAGGAALPPGEPEQSVGDLRELLEGQLDYCRGAVLRKFGELPQTELRRTRLPSGWTPLELLHHLTHVERRWLVWGFQGEQVPEPWADADADDRWRVPEGMTAEEVVTGFREQAERSRKIASGADLGTRACAGGRFPAGPGAAEPPTLGWILFHLLQEYARHAGHLDIATELADGPRGE